MFISGLEYGREPSQDDATCIQSQSKSQTFRIAIYFSFHFIGSGENACTELVILPYICSLQGNNTELPWSN